ncbi:MAG: ferrous iron transport protein A [Clostridia bacterium]|nr:ferrous iron transport protein A [Clostridia bacterium]
MENIKPLSKTVKNEISYVKKLCASEDELRRFFDLGIIKNTKIETLMKSPSGDPTAYFIRGAVMALRREDAEKILVKGDD